MKRMGYLSAAPRVSTNQNAQTGGPRAHIIGVINAFKANGYEVKTFIVGDRVPQIFTEKDTIKFITKNKIQTLFADFARIFLGLVNSFKAYNELKNNVDIVYERNSLLQSIGWIFKKKGIPWIMESNGIFFEEAKYERNSLILTGIAKKVEVFSYKKSDYVVCVSNTLKDLIVDKAGVDPSKVIVIPNGVDTEFFKKEKYTPIRYFQEFNIGFVGGVIEWQGLDILLNAIHILKMKGVNATITIVGDGPALDSLKLLAKELNIQNQVKFTGRVPFNDIPKYIAGFDIGFSGQINLKKSKMYHSPLKLYEYMSTSKPAIASAFDDAKKLIVDRENGFLFEQGNLDDLVRVIELAYNSIESLADMGEKCREIIVKEHSWDSRIKTMLDIIKEDGNQITNRTVKV
ncbi:glycosyltransferase family 4 protein [Mesobacillus foraminis]|uniref:glycosyltransferase family 4 protein n=1 Tax=Mesobacillus foraminis TaxID=279826 RepID=UPI000EF4E695|nr:glycosyltransferase family 4 protein [Mesobacillus foraminis]